MYQFSLRPGGQLASLLLNVGFRLLHRCLVGCDLRGGEEVETRRKSGSDVCCFFLCIVENSVVVCA